MCSSLSKSSRFCIYDLKEFSINLGFVGNRIFTHHGTLDIFIFPVQLKPKLLLKIVWRIVILDLDKGFPSGSQSETWSFDRWCTIEIRSSVFWYRYPVKLMSPGRHASPSYKNTRNLSCLPSFHWMGYCSMLAKRWQAVGLLWFFFQCKKVPFFWQPRASLPTASLQVLPQPSPIRHQLPSWSPKHPNTSLLTFQWREIFRKKREDSTKKLNWKSWTWTDHSWYKAFRLSSDGTCSECQSHSAIKRSWKLWPVNFIPLPFAQKRLHAEVMHASPHQICRNSKVCKPSGGFPTI